MAGSIQLVFVFLCCCQFALTLAAVKQSCKSIVTASTHLDPGSTLSPKQKFSRNIIFESLGKEYSFPQDHGYSCDTKEVEEQKKKCFSNLETQHNGGISILRNGKALICHMLKNSQVSIQVNMEYQCLDADKAREFKSTQIFKNFITPCPKIRM